MPPPIRLVAGLGNPGPQYANTRHNAGFWFADALAARAGGAFRSAARFFGRCCEVRIDGHELRLLEPDTFMNRSGQAISAIVRFYRYSLEELLVVHDDIDLPPGTVRLKRGGGHGGHNGLRDIVGHLGNNNFMRLRIGVGHPGSSDEVVDYVLRRAPAAEQELIEEAIERALDTVPTLIAGEFQAAMNALHRRPRKAAPPDDAPPDEARGTGRRRRGDGEDR